MDDWEKFNETPLPLPVRKDFEIKNLGGYHDLRVQSDTLLTVCSYHVTYAFQSESILYSCLNVKELLARSRHEI